MLESAEQKSTQHRLETLSAALRSGTASQVRQLLISLHPAEIGGLLQSLPHVWLTLFAKRRITH